MRAHLVVVFAILLLIEIHPALGRAQTDPQTISDIVLVTDETTNVSTTYVADETSGAIYSLANLAPNTLTPGQLKLSDLGVFFHSPELPKPSGITYYNGKLVACDRKSSAVFEIDTTTRTLSLLLKGDSLRNPTRVAVSQSGRVAVSNNSGEIILYDRSSKLVTVNRKFDSPVRLAFAGEDLLVLERLGTILFVQAKSLETEAPVVLPVEMPAKIESDIGKIIDFAFLNGIYYLLGQKQVDAYIRSKGNAIQLFSQPMDSVSLSGIAANKQGVVLKDDRNNTLWQLERPVPVTASFSKGSAKSLISVYEYLLAQKTLPIRKFVATRNYKTFEELLLDQRIIFGGISVSTEKIVNFVCRLNRYYCTPLIDDIRPFDQSIRKGQSLFLPDLTYAEIIGYETKDLSGESVRDYLANAFMFSPKIKSRFTEDFLWSLNELSKSETLEIQLQAKVPGALLALPPRRSVPPGTVIKVGKEQDSIAGLVTSCDIQFKYGARAFNLAKRIKNSIKGSAALAQLPRASVVSSFTKRLKQLGIDQVQFELNNPTVEQGDKQAISSAMARLQAETPEPSATPDPAATQGSSPILDPKTCLMEQISPGSYLVVDSVKVKSGRYKIFKNGSLVRLNQSEIQRLGLLGEPDPTGEWSLIVNDSYYVAYRLSPWSDKSVLKSPTTQIIASPRQIRPGGSQDILALRDVSLLLPYVSQWQVTFLVRESELTNETSEFSKLKAAHNFAALRAEETTQLLATLNPRAITSQQLPLDTVRRNREDLAREISYAIPDASPDDLAVRIGIGEIPCSVDKRHPDFTDENSDSAWITDPNDSPPTCRVGPTPAEQRRVKPPSEYDEYFDHGTHVAGILGARSNSVAPGLVPFSKLFLINASTPESIYTSLRSAVQRDVFIFNFSFNLSANSPDLKESIRNEFNNQLFIVAVDNKGTDLTAGSDPPVSWMDDIKKNMIGVGSAIQAAGTEYVLGDWKSSDGQIARGSSYSKKYVHLVAPGYGVYSTIAGNAYAETTGASQAAPQVTAAAALLFAKKIREPERIKARLIYTADWFEQLRGKVWGGFLNIKRAVWQLDRNLVTTQSEPAKVEAMTIDESVPDQLKIMSVLGTKSYNPDGEERPPDIINVPFTKVLRITLLPNSRYRVIFLDQNQQLRIILNARIAGVFPCKKLEDWDEKKKEFVGVGCDRYIHRLDVNQVFDYVAKVPQIANF